MSETDNSDIIKELEKKFSDNNFSFDGFSERDILCLLFSKLSGGVSDPAEKASACLSRLDSIERLMGADPSELTETGLLDVEQDSLLLISQMLKHAALERFQFPLPLEDTESFGKYLQTLYRCCENERLYIFLVKNGEITGCRLIVEGEYDSVKLDYEGILSIMDGAKEYILAHTHPYSPCEPSSADRSNAKYIAGKLKKLGADHICHYTIGNDGIDIVLGKPNYAQILMTTTIY